MGDEPRVLERAADRELIRADKLLLWRMIPLDAPYGRPEGRFDSGPTFGDMLADTTGNRAEEVLKRNVAERLLLLPRNSDASELVVAVAEGRVLPDDLSAEHLSLLRGAYTRAEQAFLSHGFSLAADPFEAVLHIQRKPLATYPVVRKEVAAA